MSQIDNPLPFAPAEYVARRDRLRAAMSARGIDVIVVGSLENICYLTGFGSAANGRTALVMRQDGEGVWVLRRTEFSNIRALAPHLWVRSGTAVHDGGDYTAATTRAIAELSPPGAKVAVEFASLPSHLAPFVSRSDGKSATIDASGMVEAMRRVKTPDEIALLRRARAIAARSCQDGFEALRENMTDVELGAVVTASLIRNGSDRVVQMPAVCAGPRTARAHITWCGEAIGRGEVINIEPAACILDYHTPVFRIYSIGEPSSEICRMFDVCRAALDEGYARVRPGMTSHEAARIFETVIEKAGYGEFMVTRPAYSIGLALPPGWGEDDVIAIRAGSERVLEEGMCFHVVPCLYRDGVGCVAASMPSVLTARGFESLSGDEAVIGVR